MEIEEFQAICLPLPGVTEDIKWEHNLCFCVCEKIFCMVNLDEHPHTFSVKVSDADFDILLEKDGIIQAPYMAKNKWIRVESTSKFTKDELKTLILEAYNIIKSKLPKRLQNQLEEN